MSRVDVDDVVLLERLRDAGLLGPLATKHLAQRQALEAEVAAAHERLKGPSKRPRPAATAFFDIEPTKGIDQVALAVLHDEDGLGSRLANVPETIGESGSGANQRRWVWQAGLEFVARDVWSTIRRAPEVRSRLLVLDPGRKNAGDFSDLFGLLTQTSTPAKLAHLHEVWRELVRAAEISSIALLELWAAHPDVKRDRQRARIVAESLARARASAQAAE